MTKFNYMDEMQRLCVRVSQAVKVTGDEKLEDFYLAASEGFARRLQNMTVENAESWITDSQYQGYRNLKSFCEKKEYQAATIQREAQEAEIKVAK
ncbi:MAG: hypothetical protein J6S85_01640 [Methanobrevibacter sp.]|nr:hypothetical protein [Methanobrevibacter sp.]MBO7712237.1 hypothetical protein [Methanobrevibacter sp.]